MTTQITQYAVEEIRSRHGRVDTVESRVDDMEDSFEDPSYGGSGDAEWPYRVGLAHDADAAVAWLVEYKAWPLRAHG